MLVALNRLSASLPPTLARSCSYSCSLRLHYYPRASSNIQRAYLSTRGSIATTTTAMFKAAVKNHTAAATPANAPPAASKQQSLTNAFARPLSTLSGNAVKQHNTVVTTERKAPAQNLGTKRTSSGLAKALGSQDDSFDYSSSFDSDWENQISNMSGQMLQDLQAHVPFDEGDFEDDSDIDLDFEDPSSMPTVSATSTKPLTQFTTFAKPLNRSTPSTTSSERSNQSATSTERSASSTTSTERSTPFITSTKPPTQSAYQKSPEKLPSSPHAPSTQPIPWSSSPPSHFQTPPRIVKNPPPVPEKTAQVPEKTKRRTLPWLQKRQPRQATLDNELEELETEPPRKKRSTQTTTAVKSTPMAKPKAEYPWNTTQSAIKEQQKNLREANKKTNRGINDDEVKAAIAKKKKNTIHRIFLSEEQQHVLNLVTEYKKSVFFTGSAGTGKSVLLREIIAALRRKYIREPDRIAVTASTGLAACNIGGVTLHSFAGIGLGKEPVEDLVKKIRRNAKAKQRWMRTKVLIIDEVSMVDGELFDKLEQIARTIRNNGRPFGGIQLVITGDFFQLPPVPESGRVAKFAFDAGTWTTSIEHTIGLHHVFRQKDPVFANMLNEMREGRLTADSIAKFQTLSRPLPPSEDNIEATELFPTRSEVDRANQIRMNQLSGQIYTFESRDGGTITDKERRDKLLQSCMVPEQIHLKKGAQVMLVKNMDDTLVNGSLGKVFGFMTEQLFNYYKDNEEEFLGGNTPELDSLKAMKEKTLGVSTATLYPVVRFAIADGTTRDLLLKRESWKIELPNGEVQASREQIPLILAWALSIHKAQGQTLERVTVDLGKVFEKGQAYVALSRATSMAGLQVKRFNASKVIAHEKVRAFYSSLSRAEHIQEKEKDSTILGKMQKAKRKAGDE